MYKDKLKEFVNELTEEKRKELKEHINKVDKYRTFYMYRFERKD